MKTDHFIENIHYSKDLESAILGACLLEKDAIGRIYGILKPEMFWMQKNREIFSVMVHMYSDSIPIDHLTVLLKMQVDQLDNDLAYYLTQLSRDVVSSAHLEYHGMILKTMWQRRELESITKSGVDPEKGVGGNVREINNRINQILGTDASKDWYSMTDLIYGLMTHQQDISEGKKSLVTTGWKFIDKMNGGFSEGDLVIIGARPGVGKSAIMAKTAVEIARQGKEVGIISLEMNNTQIAARISSIESGVDFRTIYQNLFQDEKQRDHWYNTITRKSLALPIYVSDKTRTDVLEIKSKAQKLAHRNGCKCLIIDYLQLVESDKDNFSREQEVAKISRSLKLLAMEMKIPIIILCQLSREVVKRSHKDRYPKLSDLRESGSLEQDADVVMMLHRDWTIGILADENGNSTETMADLLGLKWRNGSPFHMNLTFNPSTMTFSEGSQIQLKPIAPSLPYAEKDNPF